MTGRANRGFVRSSQSCEIEAQVSPGNTKTSPKKFVAIIARPNSDFSDGELKAYKAGTTEEIEFTFQENQK